MKSLLTSHNKYIPIRDRHECNNSYNRQNECFILRHDQTAHLCTLYNHFLRVQYTLRPMNMLLYIHVEHQTYFQFHPLTVASNRANIIQCIHTKAYREVVRALLNKHTLSMCMCMGIKLVLASLSVRLRLML